MVNYGDEIERAGEETRRRLARLREDMADWNQRIAATSRALTEQSAHEMRQFWTEQERILAQRQADAEQGRAERDRRDAEERQPRETQAVRLRGEAQRPADKEARKQREAIARSAAARRANDVVTPIDDDGDEEAEYYRRPSWLV
ncbi:hypothetical protein [Nocardia brevicatena]|uniref:hypothetical protein n=1 Tax=Nocardia brevicatena TaxID=37327 RepID=UPI000316F72C|nr:hypothetical protein [Nocardia brevicatena]